MIASNPSYFGGDPEKDRPAQPGGAFVLGKENPQMIAMPVESFDRIAEAVVLIAQVLERLGPKEEVKEEPIQRMLTPEEVSAILRLNVQTVMKWCREGRITATKCAGKWLIRREEVERYLHRNEIINGKKRGGAK